mmetsp:Transcript_5565/g.8225  ORF Transcript_5565/g.8225 Transcript_5565/m.8225 type:complete len:93 (-) Transcript_5565:277-555(-)
MTINLNPLQFGIYVRCRCYLQLTHNAGVLNKVLARNDAIPSPTFQKITPTGYSRLANIFVHSINHLKIAARKPFTTNELNPREASYFPRLIQ